MTRHPGFSLSLLVVSTMACSDPPDDLGVDGGPDPDGYAPLIAGDWTLAPGTEAYRCVRWTAPGDLLLAAVRPVAPSGTHHVVLMVGSPDAPDGDRECTSALEQPIVYGAGLGTDPYVLPDGVAIKVLAGQQLLLNLHLYNASSEPLSGRSGVDAVTVTPDRVTHEAGVVLAGKADGLTVDVGRTTQTGTCTAPGPSTVFGLVPHMHQLGVHMTVTHQSAAGARTLLDEDFAFDRQLVHPIAPVVDVTRGDRLVVECTYVNSTGRTVTFGESSEAEMCFAVLYVYPPPAGVQCTR